MSTGGHSPWILVASGLAAMAATPVSAQTLTAAQLVERNAAARGGREAWRRIQTMAWAGHVEGAGGEARRMPFVLEQKRPDRSRFQLAVGGQPAVRVFDGSEGWKMRTGATGRPEVQPYTADELTFARGAAAIEGPLMDQAARGATITLVGVEPLAGRKSYVLALRLPSGVSSHVWVDAETFLEGRYDREFVTTGGRPMTTSMTFSDYRTVEGLVLPFMIDAGTEDGAARRRLVVERVALNPPLDDRAFSRPGAPTYRHRGVTVDTRSAAAPGAPRPGR